MTIKIMLVLMILLIISMIYHKRCQKIEFKKYPPLGDMIEVGEDRMHIYGQGEGSPTLVFTCGYGMGFTLGNFYDIFSELAKKTRVLVYDRFGYGWSDSTSRPRTLKQINEDLYELLDKSQETAPYILIGHSMGATEVLQFAQLYPELVDGIVMLDGGSPNFDRKNASIFLLNLFPSIIGWGLRTTGTLRILTKFNKLFKDKSSLEEIEKISETMFYNKLYSKNSLQELINSFFNSFEPNNKLGDIPLLILTAQRKGNNKLTQDFMKDQRNLLNWSKNSKQIIIEDADHFFPIKKPEIVLKEISWFLNNMVD